MQPYATPHDELQIPESVSQLAVATERGLGQPVDVRCERSTGSMVGVGMATFAGGLVLAVAIGAYNSAHDAATYGHGGGTSQHLWAPTAAIMLIGLASAIGGLVIGTRKHYLYTGGLVYQRRSGAQLLAWHEIVSVRAVYGKDRGGVVAYHIAGSKNLFRQIPLSLDASGHDSFMDRLLDLARRNECPIY